MIAQINSSWATRVRRDDLVTFLVDGTHGSAMAGLTKCWTQHRVNTPKPVWNPDQPQSIDFYAAGTRCRTTSSTTTASRLQWEMFLRHLVEDAPWKLHAGRGRQGRPAGRARAEKLADAPLAGRAGAGALRWLCCASRPPTAGSRPTATAAPPVRAAANGTPFNRTAYAAAHVVADPLADGDPWLDAGDRLGHDDRASATISGISGLGVAEAMDTAQRGMGLGWPEAQALIATGARGGARPARRADRLRRRHRSPGARARRHGRRRDPRLRGADRDGRGARRPDHPDGQPGAGRRRCAARRTTCGSMTASSAQVREPVIIHWLGEMFDPALAGYWGSGDHWEAMETCLDVIAAHAAKVDGIKISLLSKEKEIAMRRRLPEGVRDVYRRRLQLRGADRRRRGGAFRCAARHLRCHRAGGLGGAGGAGAGRAERVLRHPGADGAAVAAHLQGADPLLQDRRGVPRLPQRPAGPFHHGRRPGERALAGASRRAVPACGQGAACCADPDLAAARMRGLLAVHGIA